MQMTKQMTKQTSPRTAGADGDTPNPMLPCAPMGTDWRADAKPGGVAADPIQARIDAEFMRRSGQA